MAFVLAPTRPIPEAVSKAAEKQLRKMVEGLSGETDLGPDEAAHDARKRTKKLRARLRLARPELGDEVYRRENVARRDAARLLSPVRDAWVLIEALDDLVVPPGREPVTGGRGRLARRADRRAPGAPDGTPPASSATLSRQVLGGPGGPFPLSHKGPEPVRRRTFPKICGASR